MYQPLSSKSSKNLVDLFDLQEQIYALFPRPVDDNGLGGHGSSGGIPPVAGTPWDNWAYQAKLNYYLEQHDRRALRWYKILGDGSEDSVMHVKAIKDAGLEPLVRVYTEKPHFSYRVDPQIVRLYVAAGCRLFEYGNEANLGLEVEGLVEGQPVIGRHYVVAFCQQFIANTEAIVAGGGICLMPALAPAAALDPTGELVCYQSIIEWFKAEKLDDGTSAYDWFRNHLIAGHIGIAFHPRGGNHVVVRANGEVIIDYPDDPVNQLGEPISDEDAAFHGIGSYEQYLMNEERESNKNDGDTLWDDPTSYVVWDLIAFLFKQAFGVEPPGFATEAGPEPGESWEGRYPRTTLVAHSMVAMEIIRRMNPKHPKAARRSHFANFFWVYNNHGHGKFRAAGWQANQDIGGDLPVIAALEAFATHENFVRTWDDAPDPIEPDEEEPTMTLAEQYPAQTAAWIAAGGDPDLRLRMHLAATGAISVTAEEYQAMVEGVQANVAELAAIGRMLPLA